LRDGDDAISVASKKAVKLRQLFLKSLRSF
jgi:hypothetical protein